MIKQLESYQIKATLEQHPAIAQVMVKSLPEANGAQTQRFMAYIIPQDRDACWQARSLGFSLFYFADAHTKGGDKYKLYLEGAKLADQYKFEAIWTPERHFHPNGGLYPNPSVLSASLATLTNHVRLRSGSVALPLHHPLRVAEEWSVVDNLSQGRVDLSITSGWIPNDFAIAPTAHSFKQKRDIMFDNIELIQSLWQGGKMSTQDGVGKHVELEIYPKPIQPKLPIWLTCSGDPEMFRKAGAKGFNILTALLTQPLEEAAEKIAIYRQARAENGLDPDAGHVTLMLHTFVEDNETSVREAVQVPLTEYLRSHIGLMETMVQSLNIQLDHVDIQDPKWANYLASFAFERYYRTGSLIGTPDSCRAMVNKLKEMSVDEVACLVDFGVETDRVLASLSYLNQLKEQSNQATFAQFLETALPQSANAVTFSIVDTFPVANGHNKQIPHQTPTQSNIPVFRERLSKSPSSVNVSTVDNRAQKQKAAMKRQKQLIQRGRKA